MDEMLLKKVNYYVQTLWEGAKFQHFWEGHNLPYDFEFTK